MFLEGHQFISYMSSSVLIYFIAHRVQTSRPTTFSPQRMSNVAPPRTSSPSRGRNSEGLPRNAQKPEPSTPRRSTPAPSSSLNNTSKTPSSQKERPGLYGINSFRYISAQLFKYSNCCFSYLVYVCSAICCPLIIITLSVSKKFRSVVKLIR